MSSSDSWYGAGLQGCPRNLRLQTFSMDGVMDGGYELLDGVVWAFGPFGGGLEIYPLLKRSIATWPR